jgi:hypothetical protein
MARSRDGRHVLSTFVASLMFWLSAYFIGRAENCVKAESGQVFGHPEGTLEHLSAQRSACRSRAWSLFSAL